MGQALASSSGSPVCDILPLSLPFAPMSTVLDVPAPSGWRLRPGAPVYYPGEALEVAIDNTDPSKRARGILLWSRNAGGRIGSWTLPAGNRFRHIVENPACGTASLTHADAEPKTQSSMRFTWVAPAAGAGTVAMRAFVIEDCAAPTGGCRGAQALTDFGYTLLEEGVFRNGFEAP